MSDPVLAEKNASTILAGVLARYKEASGNALQPPDPRRLFMQSVVLELAQQRALIDFAGKQSLLRFVSDLWIAFLAELWGEDKLPAEPSTCMQRFTFTSSVAASSALASIVGARVGDGTNQWAVLADPVPERTDNVIDAKVECTVAGASSNSVAVGQIDTQIDPLTDCESVENTTETAGGRDVESLEAFRERLRDVPESRSTCGPRAAYQAAALEASSTVADAVALGPEDEDVASYLPGPSEVFVLIIEGERDEEGAVISVVPEPSDGLLNLVDGALTPEDVRPLADFVTVMPPIFSDFTAGGTYYIAESRSESETEIRAAVEAAWDSFLLWQQSKIGRDINPAEAIARLVTAGAKRFVPLGFSFTQLLRDQCARLTSANLAYGGIEDD